MPRRPEALFEKKRAYSGVGNIVAASGASMTMETPLDEQLPGPSASMAWRGRDGVGRIRLSTSYT
ncbi:MAG TPA: hypothetical protein VER98_02475, partial [Terriglobia bacterium]|nr:hypothetical protein [Terriglobia bacterium]